MFEKIFAAIKSNPKRSIWVALILAAGAVATLAGDFSVAQLFALISQVFSDASVTGEIPALPLPQ